MRKSFWDKRIPTLFGIIILILGTVLTTFVANKKQFVQVNALSSDQPQNVRITNITDTSFTVSYTTGNKTSGSINYGKDKSLGQSALDDRDQGKVNNYLIHTITAKNLVPSTKYLFTVTSGQQIYTTQGNDFEVTTAPTLDGQSTQTSTLEGDIVTTEGSPPKEAIIYFTAENSQVISFLADINGHYSFPLLKVRTNDLASFYNFVENKTVKMLITGDDGSISNVLLSIPTNNVPTITLSKDYDFTQNTKAEASPSANLNDSLTFSENSSSQSAKTPEIITPQKNEGFSEQQPLFTGTAVPDQDVQIVIHSTDPVSAVVTADSLGNWSYQPSSPLSPGTHTITITTKNSLGILQTLTQSFVVYAATDSPTPTLEIITDTVTPTPQDLLSETATVSATPTGQLPPSGNPTIIMVGIIGLIISFIGGLLFLLTRGGI